MKNKKLLWFLIPALLLVWGLIGYRVVMAMKGNSTLASSQPVIELVVPVVEDTIHYEPSFNYKDPFLKSLRPIKPSIASKVPAEDKGKSKPKPTVTKTVKLLPLQWPKVSYMGLIKGGSGATGLIEVNGNSIFLSEGEVQEEMKLLVLSADSIQLEYREREKKTFRKR